MRSFLTTLSTAVLLHNTERQSQGDARFLDNFFPIPAPDSTSYKKECDEDLPDFHKTVRKVMHKTSKKSSTERLVRLVCNHCAVSIEPS